MTCEQEIAGTSRPSAEPPKGREEPWIPGQDWLDGVATDDDDERRRLLRELVIRALV